MSDTEPKTVKATTAAIAGALALGGTIFGGGMQVAEFKAEIEAAKAESARLKEEATKEKAEAIAACEATAEKGMREQQARIELLLKRFEALARDRNERPDINQYEKFGQMPNVFHKGAKR